MPELAGVNDQASEKFRAFAERTLAPGGENAAGHRTLVNILLSDANSPRAVLLSSTSATWSAAACSQPRRLTPSAARWLSMTVNCRKRIQQAKVSRQGPAGQAKLRQLFEARNEIVHELHL